MPNTLENQSKRIQYCCKYNQSCKQRYNGSIKNKKCKCGKTRRDRQKEKRDGRKEGKRGENHERDQHQYIQYMDYIDVYQFRVCGCDGGGGGGGGVVAVVVAAEAVGVASVVLVTHAPGWKIKFIILYLDVVQSLYKVSLNFLVACSITWLDLFRTTSGGSPPQQVSQWLSRSAIFALFSMNFCQVNMKVV